MLLISLVNSSTNFTYLAEKSENQISAMRLCKTAEASNLWRATLHWSNCLTSQNCRTVNITPRRIWQSCQDRWWSIAPNARFLADRSSNRNFAKGLEESPIFYWTRANYLSHYRNFTPQGQHCNKKFWNGFGRWPQREVRLKNGNGLWGVKSPLLYQLS